MPRLATFLAVVCMCSVPLSAQDIENLQIHGFLTQSLLFSSNNNYLTMKSSSGSLQWNEGAVSFNDSISEKLRVGIQLHMYHMGEIGGPNVMVDWVSGDYKVNDRLGVRAGKIKVPLGLFNDSQDVDALFLWTLLPQAHYPNDNRDFDLAALGGEVYGRVPAGRYGKILYRGYAGENRLDADGGYVRKLADYGFIFADAPSGKVYGGDVRWATPWKGVVLGSSIENQGVDGRGPQGTLHLAPSLLTAYYGEWAAGKWYFAAEYWRLPFTALLQAGPDLFGIPIDQRSWYPMVSYQLTKRLQAGTYYSHSINKAVDASLPENHSKDWAISGRYNFNANFYGKVEGHFLHGTMMGYDTGTNPDGLKSNTFLLAARVGFTF